MEDGFYKGEFGSKTDSRKNDCDDSVIGREGGQFSRYLGYSMDRTQSVSKCGCEKPPRMTVEYLHSSPELMLVPFSTEGSRG